MGSENTAHPVHPNLPVQIRLEGRTCTVVGGGRVAVRKAAKLLAAGARVRVIAPALEGEGWDGLVMEHLARPYGGPADLEGFLVVAATSDSEANGRIAREARAKGALVLRADAPEDSDISFPATLRRGALSVSIATEGRCPALAARLRREAEVHYDRHFEIFLDLVAELRALPRFRDLPGRERERILTEIAESDLLARLGWESTGEVREAMFRILDGLDHPLSEGTVTLVGAGPGDPGLLTLKAAEALRAAEIVLHDALANPALLDLHAPQAERIDVGKHKGDCVMTQTQINELLVRLGREGKRIVRLKGGDPYLFGRGGEEARALSEAGVGFTTVPGVSSLSAVPASAGIPVTDRDFGNSVGAFSLHKHHGQGPSEDEWHRMAHGPETLVLFMGKTMLALACDRLVAHGRPADTPAAMVVNGTLRTQQVIQGTLATLAEQVAREKLNGPGLIVVGQVVGLRQVLQGSGEGA
nr:uroporphyrinogen-III C-methyltransferase [uncultured Holophaga sp.]